MFFGNLGTKILRMAKSKRHLKRRLKINKRKRYPTPKKLKLIKQPLDLISSDIFNQLKQDKT